MTAAHVGFATGPAGRAVAAGKAADTKLVVLENLYMYGPHGSRHDAYGRVWHLPHPPTRTTRQVVADLYAAADSDRTQITALNRPMLAAFGLFNRNVHELLHTYYQFNAPHVVDDSAFRDAIGGQITSWAEIVTTTVDRYRTNSTNATAHGPSGTETEKVTS